MKRPQSAKPGHQYLAASGEDGNIESRATLVRYGKGKTPNFGLLKQDVTRLIPKRIMQDKEKLYGETIQLKNFINQISQENVKLKTKVAILEREKERLQREKGVQNKVAVGFLSQKESSVVSNLKKLVRDSREEAAGLREELLKMKKAVRFTKLNEIELEKQTVFEQNKRMAAIISQLSSKLQQKWISQEQELNQMDKRLKIKANQLNEVSLDNARYEQVLEDLQNKNQQLSDKIAHLEKKFQKDLGAERKKIEQLAKANQGLRADKKMVQEKLCEQQKKQKISRSRENITRPASSNPYSRVSPSLEGITSANTNKQDLMQANSKLTNQLKETKQKLSALQNQLKFLRSEKFGCLNRLGGDQPFQLILTKNEPEDLANCVIEQESAKGVKQKEKKKSQGNKEFRMKKNQKNADCGMAVMTVEKQQSRKMVGSALQQIRTILTYRMKYNRYTFAELRGDIESSPIKMFSYQDLLAMLTEEPFHLSGRNATLFLSSCFQSYRLSSKEQLPSNLLIEYLRTIIDDFQLLDEEEEEKLLYQVAYFVTSHRSQMESKFNAIASVDKMVSLRQLEEMLKDQNELNKVQIDLALCCVVAGVESLDQIDYTDFLDRFRMSKEDEGVVVQQSNKKVEKDDLSLGQNEQIIEQQMQDYLI